MLEATKTSDNAQHMGSTEAAGALGKMQIDASTSGSKAGAAPANLASAGDKVPTASINSKGIEFGAMSGSISGSRSGTMKMASTCRWTDDAGNTGFGQCDFSSGTIRRNG